MKIIKKAQKGTNLKKDVRTVAVDNTRVKKLPTFSQIKSGEKILTAKKNKNYEESLKNKAAQKRKEANNADMLSIELMMSDNNFNRSKLADKLTSERKKSADSLENLAKKNKTNPKYKPALKNGGSTPAWTRSEGKDPKGGLNRKGVASYRRANPGSKLKTAVTTKPSKLKPGSKAAKRRKSFCARMGGVKGPMKKDGKPTRKALALRKWNC